MFAGGELQIHCFVAQDLLCLTGKKYYFWRGQEADFSSPHIFNFIFVTIIK